MEASDNRGTTDENETQGEETGLSDANKRIGREAIRRRRETLFRKADELGKMSDAHIYILVYDGGRYYLYSSRDEPSWPPSKEHIVYLIHPPDMIHTNEMQNRSFPIPKKRTPADFRLRRKGIKR